MPDTPSILIAVDPWLQELLFDDAARAALAEAGDVTWQADEKLDADRFAELLPGRRAVITCWGTPSFKEPVLAAADQLQLIAHAAGSVKGLCPDPVYDRGIKVTHAAAAIAEAVSDWTVMSLMMGLRGAVPMQQQMSRQRMSGRVLGTEIDAATVGVVAASFVGRGTIERLVKLGATVKLYDPYITDGQAAALGARRVDTVDELCETCDALTLHAPKGKDTDGMVGAAQLAKLRDGAVVVNTARGPLIDHDALLAECQAGRLTAVLDVTDPEPLPEDSPFRTCDHVYLTPHAAGFSVQARKRQGDHMVEDVRRFFAGEPMVYEVTPARRATMA